MRFEKGIEQVISSCIINVQPYLTFDDGTNLLIRELLAEAGFLPATESVRSTNFVGSFLTLNVRNCLIHGISGKY